MTEPIRILTVDDHPLLRDGIAFAVQAEGDMAIVAEAATADEAVEMFRLHRPDVTLMDLQLPGGKNGIDALQAIRHEFPEARVIVITTYSGDVLAARALRAGAAGYLLKGALRKELIVAIRQVHEGQKRIPYEVAAGIAQHVASEMLTVREIEILRSVAAGHSNKSIGLVLGISEETVKGHMRNILGKLEANDRAHAVTIALKRGFLDG
jgi:DNA-binding NarL/FixJ family response regulator